MNSLKKVRTINEKPREIILLKNNNVLIIDNEDKIKIYDNKFETFQLEHLSDYKYQSESFICYKYFPTSDRYNPDFLFLFSDNFVYVYQILYYRKKTFEIESGNKIKRNINIKLIDKFETYVDVIELPKYENSIFFLKKQIIETNKLLYQYEIENMYTNITNLKLKAEINVSDITEPVFRKLFPVNSDKFILASYTLKFKNDDGEYVIEGINQLRFINSNNFRIKRKFDIKISPFKRRKFV